MVVGLRHRHIHAECHRIRATKFRLFQVAAVAYIMSLKRRMKIVSVGIATETPLRSVHAEDVSDYYKALLNAKAQ